MSLLIVSSSPVPQVTMLMVFVLGSPRLRTIPLWQEPNDVEQQLMILPQPGPERKSDVEAYLPDLGPMTGKTDAVEEATIGTREETG
ncbi:hypothetical protein [Luteococcus japonicus]|uniref:hypothetical protein n=1 Tax=Luteococcus japonicus TaxID=33984 RepID=UPI00117D6D91|nr:hypothetical protein [Luteococcus japonicus]